MTEHGSPAEAGFMAAVLVVMFVSRPFSAFFLLGAVRIGPASVSCDDTHPVKQVFFSMVLVWNVGLLDTTEALSGFSNSGMLANGALFVVIKGVEKSQFADKAARRVFGLKTSQSAGLARMMALCFALSAFLNNTPVVALLIPITRDWARARGFSPSIFLIPLSYSVIFGGLLTLIGTSTNLVVQGLIRCFIPESVQAAFLAAGAMVLGGWVDAKQAVGHINWRLLLLIGSALGLSKGVVNSGLASYVGTAIRNSGMSADASLFVISIGVSW